MATIQLGTTGSASRLISYAEKRAEVRQGVNCNPDYAKSQFSATRELFGKTGGIQAHHVIQSFKPDETTPEQANEIGVALAKKLAKGHECTVYTHTDKSHIHNHIVINNVNFETGKKFQLHGKKAIERVRSLSDDLCQERGLSVVKEPSAKVRYKLAEQAIIEKGGTSWKEEIRKVIDFEKSNSTNYADFKKNLTEKYGITVNDTRKHITYKHPENGRVVRGKTLGLDYERGTIENGFNRQIARTTGAENFHRDILLGGLEEKHGINSSGTSSTLKPSERFEQSHESAAKQGNDREEASRRSTYGPLETGQQSLQGTQSRDEKPKSEQQREDGKESPNHNRSDKEAERVLSRNDSKSAMADLGSETDRQAILEEPSQDLRNESADIDRSVDSDSGIGEVGNAFGDILKSLDHAVKQADAEAQAEANKQARKLEQKMTRKPSRSRAKSHEDDLEL